MLQAWSESHGVSLEVVVGARRGFRHRARLSSRGGGAAPRVGVFARGTHRVVNIPRCEIHHPLINQVVRALQQGAQATHVTGYDETTHRGLLRGVQICVERSTGLVRVVLVCNAKTFESSAPLAQRLEAQLGGRLHSLWWNGNPTTTNRFLGDRWHRFRGAPFLVDHLGGASVFFPPGAFAQSNPQLFDQLVKRAHGWVPEGSRVMELYAGCGAIGLGLVARAAQVTFNEISEDSLRGLRRGLEELPSQTRRRTRLLPGSADLAVAALDESSTLIVDPPRKGLSDVVVDAIGCKPPARIVYVSCGPQALIRESIAFQAAGLFLREAVVYDLFPYTEHVETLARFERESI